jgi:hypothetical protein
MAKARSSGGKSGGGRGEGATRPAGAASAQTGHTGGDCIYAGQHYSEGAIIDHGGVMQRCVNGKWQIVDPNLRHRGATGGAT